jgi:hypothetical protein
LQCNTKLWTVICAAPFIPTSSWFSATAATARTGNKLSSEWAALVVRVVLKSSEDLSGGDDVIIILLLIYTKW